MVIFTDSLSALQALENNISQDRDIGQLAKSYDIQATLQWIPGHEDVCGNERADQLAKEDSKKEQINRQCNTQLQEKSLEENSNQHR